MDSLVNATMRDYTKVIGISPMLTKKEEWALGKTICKLKSGKIRQAAREKLFNANLKLVLKRAHYYSIHAKAPFADLVQAGMEGLGNAIDRYNPIKFKTRFSTYATSWIQLKIFHTLSEFENMVYVPQSIALKSREYKKILAFEGGKDLSNNSLMELLQTSEYVLRNIKAVNSSIISLDNTPFVKNDSYSKSTLKDTILDPKHISVSDCMVKEEVKETLKVALDGLEPIQREILVLRYLDDNEKNGLQKLGRKYNLTGERIRQIEYKALKKLRRRLKNKSFFKI